MSSPQNPFFILAPMDEVTDTVFRQIILRTAAPDFMFTEFVNVDGLMSPGRPNLLKKLRFDASETKLVAQLWGLEPDNFKSVARQIADGSLARELGLPEGCNFVGVDLNMGCPAKGEVQNGACSALIKIENRDLAKRIIDATKTGLNGSLPLSVKTRLGFNEVDTSWFEFLLDQRLDMITIHGRTRKEMSKVPAHWENLPDFRSYRNEFSPQTLLVANGDIITRQQGLELAANYKLDGVMIGRGIFQDPYVFADGPSPWLMYTEDQKIALYLTHVKLFAETWQNRERPVHTLNKFCKMYINGFNGSKELRERLMSATSVAELIEILTAQ